MHENIPEELRALPQWVSWRDDKAPLIVGTKELASTTNPETWREFPESGRLGFVFTADDPYIGIDLDKIDDETKEIAMRFDSYTEYSPSSNGLHIFIRGKLPWPGKKNGPVEIYQEKRYFTVTGNTGSLPVIPIRENPEALAWFLAKYFPEPKAKPAPKIQGYSANDSRILALVNNHPPAICGSGGSNKTFELAMLLVEGFGLSDDEAYQWLCYYSEKCVPPWTEKELWHKIASARAKAVNFGHLLSTPRHGESVPLMIERSNGEYTESDIIDDDPPDPGDLPIKLEDLEGLIHFIADHSIETAHEPQPQIAVAGALALMSVITRGLTDFQRTRTNMYFVGLAPSGAGKDRPRQVNKEILIGCGEPQMAGPERLGSSAGLVTYVSHRPATLFQLDEFGSLVESMQNRQATYLKTIADVLMQLYTSSHTLWVGDAYADKNKIKQIQEPHAVVLGTSTPEVFWDSLSKRNVTEGLVGRCMVFQDTYDTGALRMPKDRDISPIISIAERWIHRGSAVERMQGQPIKAPYTKEAYARAVEHAAGIKQQRNGESREKAAIWSRTREKTSKLSLLLAASRAQSPETVRVEIQDVERAILLSNWSTRKLLTQVYGYVYDSERERDLQTIRRIVASAPKKMLSKSEISRKTQRMARRHRDELISELVETGWLTAEQRNSSKPGTPAVVFQYSGRG